MHNVTAFLSGIALGGGAAVAASLPDSFSIQLDWRVPALVVAIAGGIWYGIRQARRERIRRQMVREYLAEPDQLEES